MRGLHLIKAWSRTQDAITLSSAEAELVALGKLAMEVLGVRSMCEEWQLSKATQASDLYADASADGLTKHVKQELAQKYLVIEGLMVRGDRADASLKLAGD